MTPTATLKPVVASSLVAPIEIPEVLDVESGIDLGIEGGVAGGVAGGVPGGVVGGVVGGLPLEAPPPPEALRIGGEISAPRKLRDVAPVYPDLARQAGIQGIVILECTIDRSGRVTDVSVLRGLPTLDAAAMEAVRQWVYSPTLVDGVPVPVIMTVTVQFRLSGARRGH